MPTNNKSKKLCCSFCGRSETEVELLIPAALGGAAICGDCVMTCANFLEEMNPEEVPTTRSTPADNRHSAEACRDQSSAGSVCDRAG